MNLEEALLNDLYIHHKIGALYNMDGKPEPWKIAYYPLFGTYKGEEDEKEWVVFEEPRALIEQPMTGGTDFREIPLRYLKLIKDE